MNKAAVLAILFVVVLLAVAVIAEAQQPTKSPDWVSCSCHSCHSRTPC